MDQTKAKRLIVACTVGAVLLLVILVSVMVYQLISIGKYQRDIEHLNEQIALYESKIAEGEDTYEVRSQRWWIEREARRLGYEYKISE